MQTKHVGVHFLHFSLGFSFLTLSRCYLYWFHCKYESHPTDLLRHLNSVNQGAESGCRPTTKPTPKQKTSNIGNIITKRQIVWVWEVRWFRSREQGGSWSLLQNVRVQAQGRRLHGLIFVVGQRRNVKCRCCSVAPQNIRRHQVFFRMPANFLLLILI